MNTLLSLDRPATETALVRRRAGIGEPMLALTFDDRLSPLTPRLLVVSELLVAP